MKCPNCEQELPHNAAFCPGCGQRISEPAAASPRAVIPPADAAGPTPPAPREKFQSGNGNSSLEDEAEVEIWHGTYSPKAMISTWIGTALLTLIALIGALALDLNGALAWTIFLGAVLLVWIFLLLRLVYMRFNVSYRLTSQRFVHEEGILRRVTDRIEVIDIDDVAFEQGLVDRLVGVGSIRLSSSDRTHSELLLKGIDPVQEIASQIDAARRRERVRRGLHIEAV
jgi:membrane protein YdbS with pleckstrin-like domain